MLFNKFWLQGLNCSSRGEVERLCGFQVSEREDVCSIAGERRLEFVSDEALALETGTVMTAVEGRRQTLLRINVKKAVALFEWICAASHAVGWECEAEWPTVPSGFHSVGSLEKNLLVFK